MLTPPGPIKSPTMIKMMPIKTPPLTNVTMPQITRTTAMIHRIVETAPLAAKRVSKTVSLDARAVGPLYCPRRHPEDAPTGHFFGRDALIRRRQRVLSPSSNGQTELTRGYLSGLYHFQVWWAASKWRGHVFSPHLVDLAEPGDAGVRRAGERVRVGFEPAQSDRDGSLLGR